jgi:hypothetical protein
VVDCSPGNWAKHWYGDYGLTGVLASNFDTSLLGLYENYGGRFVPIASNIHGEVIGEVPVPDAPTGSPAYGFAGQVTCLIDIGGCMDTNDFTIDINNNGLALWFLREYGDQLVLTSGQTDVGTFDWDAMGIHRDESLPLGLNDQNQILALVISRDCDCRVEGVLSPFEVPEPSTLLLLPTVLLLSLLAVKLRSRDVGVSPRLQIQMAKLPGNSRAV